MIENNQKYSGIIKLILDVLIICLSYFAALYIVFRDQMSYYIKAVSYIPILIAIVPIFAIIYKNFNLYNSKKLMSSVRIIGNVILSNLMGLLVMALVLYLFRKVGNIVHFSIKVFFWFIMLNTILAIVERIIIKKITSAMRRKGVNQRNILLVGFSDASDRLVDAMKRNPEWGYKIYGVLDDLAEEGQEYKKAKVIGKIEKLAGILQENVVDEVAVTLPLAAYGKLGEVVDTCEKYGVHTKFIPDYTGIIHSNPVTEDMDGVAVVNIRSVPLTDSFNRAVKRLMDILFSLFFIILFSPVMLVAAIMVKVSSPGPIIFKQKRVGYHNKEFNMYKFRSMVQQRPEDEKKGWTTKGDARVTKVGALLRKTSIDELPQFFNVLFGSMSIVGPRPERKQFVEQFMEEIPRYNVKHQVRPGITGWAQVNGLRGDTSIPERIKYDLYYIENWSVWMDIKIMFLTVFKGFVNKNAY